jgi:betaine reductase
MNPGLLEQTLASLRSFDEVVSYPPHQVFIGKLSPEDLANIEQPWYRHPVVNAQRLGPFGEIIPEREFLGLLKMADEFDLVWLTEPFLRDLEETLSDHPLIDEADLTRLAGPRPMKDIQFRIASDQALALYHEGQLVGCFRRDHDEDDSLKAQILLENLAAKASGALVMRHLLSRSDISPKDVEYVLSCSEEAVGDRYNRGGGSLAKAIGEMCRCDNATGCDVKAFCAAPIYAILHAASLVKAEVFERVVVVGGGCVAKLGMKFRGHLSKHMPLLEDVLAAIAFLIQADDGQSPIIRLDAIGKHDIGAASSQQAIIESLVAKPLDRVGKKITQVDKFATEMHNPEITLPAGSGNVPLNNYRYMAALAVLRKEIDRAEMDQFVRDRGMPGFSPTQGHVPAAVPYLGHALEAIKAGRIDNAMFVAKGSLFLGRMSQLSDGLSFLIEKNHNPEPT